MNKNLAEAFKIRYGWSPEAVLSMPDEEVKKLTEEEFKKYFSAVMELTDESFDIEHVNMHNGSPVYSEEVWD